MPSDELKQRVTPEDLAASEALRKLGIDLEWTEEEKKQFRRQYKTTLAGQAHAVGISLRRIFRIIQTKTFMKYIIRGARWLMS